MPRLLVVDDSAICREPLSIALAHEGFEVHTAANGMQALRLIRELSPDLVLLDIGMPELDGLSCLERIRKSPDISGTHVLLLTEKSDRPDVLKARALGVDGYLLKSQFSIRTLIDRINKVLVSEALAPRAGSNHIDATSQAVLPPLSQQAPVQNRRRTIDDCRISQVSEPIEPLDAGQVLARVSSELELKACPAVLQQVVGLTNSQHSSLRDVADAIRNDHALALKILRVANSSIVGANRRAKDIAEAAQRIGMGGVRNLAAAILTIESFADAEVGGLRMRWFWEHALMTAMLGEALARTLKSEAGDIFLAGLFHDLGRITLSTIYPTHYAGVLQEAESSGICLSNVEKRVFGITHAQITQTVLTRWECSEHIVELAVQHEASPEQIARSAKSPESAMIVALANAIAHAQVWGDSGNSVLLPIDKLVRALHLTDQQIQVAIREAAARGQETQLILSSEGSDLLENRPSNIVKSKLFRTPSVAVFSSRQIDELRLFFDALGFAESDPAECAVVHIHSGENPKQQLSALQEYEARLGKTLPVMILCDDEKCKLDANRMGDRTVIRLGGPIWYSGLIAVLNSITSPSASRASFAGSTH